MSNKVRNLIGFIVFIFSFSAIIASAGVHFSFIGEHLPERIIIITPDGKKVEQAKEPKYTFYDQLKEKTSQLSVKRDLTVATKGDKTANKKYLIQIGAFKTAGDARRTKKRAEKLGYPIKVVQRKSHHLVQVGPFHGMSTTKTAKNKLERSNFPTLIRLVK